MILLSGASGFIGRRLAVRLAIALPDRELTCLVRVKDDAFGEAGAEFLRSRSIQTVPSELVGGKGLGGLRAPDVLFHLAANTHTWEPDQGCNDAGTENLLRALGSLGPKTHVIFTSTTAVMDNREDLDTPLRPRPVIQRRPLSRYGLSKWRAEAFLQNEAKRQGFRLSIARLCTVYGPQPRPKSLFAVLKEEVRRRTLASRLNWPGLTSFIHVDDVVDCLLKMAEDLPAPGEARTRLLAAESHTLADVARLLYGAQGLPYQGVALPMGAWKLLGQAHRLCRWGAGRLPAAWFNALWRLNIVVNPVFHCDTNLLARSFPGLRARRLADAIGEI